MTAIPATLLPSLRSLNEMLRQFWPDHAAQNRIPLAFWLIEDDDALLFDAMQYLPCNLHVHGGRSGQGHTHEEIEDLPEGFRLLAAIFDLEDAFAGEGWLGLANLGEDGVKRAVSAYERLGLSGRAQSLGRVYAAFRGDPENEDALRQAAGGNLPDLVDDDEAFRVLAQYVRTDSERRFGCL